LLLPPLIAARIFASFDLISVFAICEHEIQKLSTSKLSMLAHFWGAQDHGSQKNVLLSSKEKNST
jgi:hypothetical protein